MNRNKDIVERLKQKFKFIREASDDVIKELELHASYQRIKKGVHIYLEGDQCGSIALLLSGSARVYKVGENGREITLYRFGSGESCILTVSCILNDGMFPALAHIEEDAEAILISAEVFKNWIDEFSSWRNFVYGILAQRLEEIILTVEEVAFHRMDSRITDFILSKMDIWGDSISITHQEIAAELGSAREVVSRILKDFEHRGLIRQKRGLLNIIDRNGLVKQLNKSSVI